jgi:hypothetical protein
MLYTFKRDDIPCMYKAAGKTIISCILIVIFVDGKTNSKLRGIILRISSFVIRFHKGAHDILKTSSDYVSKLGDYPFSF